MAATKVRIDLNAGVVELEGDEAFVSAQLDKLLPVLQISQRSTSNDREEDPPPAGASRADPTTDKKRRKGSVPPKGASCRSRILELKKDGFFSEHRSPNDI